MTKFSREVQVPNVYRLTYSRKNMPGVFMDMFVTLADDIHPNREYFQAWLGGQISLPVSLVAYNPVMAFEIVHNENVFAIDPKTLKLKTWRVTTPDPTDYYRELFDQIKADGKVKEPIIVAGNTGRVIDGSGRCYCAIKLGFPTVPAIIRKIK